MCQSVTTTLYTEYSSHFVISPILSSMCHRYWISLAVLQGVCTWNEAVEIFICATMAGAEPDAGMCHALLEIFDQQQAAQPAVQLLEECLIEVLIHLLYLCFRLLWPFSKRSLEVLYFKKSQTDLPLAAVAALMQTPEITHQTVMETCTKEGQGDKGRDMCRAWSLLT